MPRTKLQRNDATKLQRNEAAVSNQTELQTFKAAQMDVAALKELIAENMSGEATTPADLARVKIPTGGSTQWAIPTARGEVGASALDVVMIFTRLQRAYWEGNAPASGTPPTCFSDDAKTGSVFGECAVCPHAQFGSKASADGSPGSGQACKMNRPVYFLLPKSVMPLWVSLPPTSLGAMRAYLLNLSAEELPYYTVITRLTLVKEVNAAKQPYSRVEPVMLGELEPAEAENIRALRAYFVPSLSAIRTPQIIGEGLGDVTVDGATDTDTVEV